MINTIEECQEAADELYGEHVTPTSDGFNPCGCSYDGFTCYPIFKSCAFGDGQLNACTSPICRIPTPEPTPAPTAAPTAAPEPPAANGGGGTY